MSRGLKKSKTVLKIPKGIIFIGKMLSFISTKLAVLFAAKLFTTPIKYKTPKREIEMDRKSIPETIFIPRINKSVRAYHNGTGSKKILFVHGWSGRGTQFFKFVDELVKLDYAALSFDAPAHGRSSGNTTIMTEFIESILELNRQFGPFEAAIGHSLGGMSLLNAVKRELQFKQLIIIGSGDIVKDIMDDFVLKLELNPKISDLMRNHFEKKFHEKMDSFSSSVVAKEVNIPVLVIHDKNDVEVPVNCAIHIHKHLKKGELLITENLGHRKILGDQKVIEKAIQFITG